jgi:alkylated DNA repair dioxygenase AlkB
MAMTCDLLLPAAQCADCACKVELPDAEIDYYAALFDESEADRLFLQLRDEIAWRQQHIKLYGKVHAEPRLTAWYGDAGKRYTYSGIEMTAQLWLPVLLEIKTRIESVAACTFNSVLLNLYRNGADSVGWHADDELELGRNPVIASVSLGARRAFHLRHKKDKSQRRVLSLDHGSLLLMKGATQHHWVHQLPKTTRGVGARINLTYRFIV